MCYTITPARTRPLLLLLRVLLLRVLLLLRVCYCCCSCVCSTCCCMLLRLPQPNKCSRRGLYSLYTAVYSYTRYTLICNKRYSCSED